MENTISRGILMDRLRTRYIINCIIDDVDKEEIDENDALDVISNLMDTLTNEAIDKQKISIQEN